jgi:hypothetical protein
MEAVKSKDLVWRGLCKILGLICQLARGASEKIDFQHSGIGGSFGVALY